MGSSAEVGQVSRRDTGAGHPGTQGRVYRLSQALQQQVASKLHPDEPM